MKKVFALLFLWTMFCVSNTFVVNEQVSFTVNWRGFCGKRTSKLYSKTHTSLADCLIACGVRPECKAVNYRHLFTGLCELMFNTETSENRAGCLFIQREDISFTGMLQNGCGCEDGESCDVETGTCSKTECTPVLNTTNGHLFGNRYELGSRLQLQCDAAFSPQHQPMTCMPDGDWDEIPVCTVDCSADAGWLQFGTHCYLLHNEVMSFYSAKSFCEDRGSALVRVNSEEENSFLKDEIQKSAQSYGMAHYWLGLRRRDNYYIYNYWIWVDKKDYTNTTYTAWARGQPNQYQGENCAVFAYHDQWWWHDLVCHALCRPICYYHK